MTSSAKPSILSGVRVLDFGHYIAAPILTRMIADMGAEISKIELTRNESVLSRYLGYSGEKVAALTGNGVLIQEPLVQEMRERGEIP